MARDLEDELDQLRQLRDTGALSDAEYRRAKAVIQGDDPEPDGEPRSKSTRMLDKEEAKPRPKRSSKRPRAAPERGEEDVARLSLETQLLRLDNDWEVQRQYYLLFRKYGDPVEPSWVSMAVRLIGGAIAIGIGVWFLLRGPVKDTVVGALLLFLGGIWPLYHGHNFWAFTRAHSEYQKRRRRLVGAMSDLEE